MSKISCDPATIKAQIRLALLRLGQLQANKDSQGAITRREIASLLQQRNIRVARTKAQELMREDALGDLSVILEMHLGILLEHFNELDSSAPISFDLKEAASTIIFAAPYVGSKDLDAVRDFLVECLGEEFTYAATGNDNNHVTLPVIRAVTASSPSSFSSTSAINASLEKIARDCGLSWSLEPQREELLDILLEILDPQISPVVDLPRLRLACRRGLPDEPGWLRPRIWKILLGTLPILKASWKRDMQKQRESYYDLSHQLLEPLSHLPPPTNPLCHTDAVLLDVSQQLSNAPSALFIDGLKEPKCSINCPVHGRPVRGEKSATAGNLDNRLRVLRIENSHPLPVPGTVTGVTPKLSLPPSGPATGDVLDGSAIPPVSDSCDSETLHKQHRSALLRLLYLHTLINPGNTSPQVPSLLVLLYGVLNREIEPEDWAHVEADTFWLFEAMMGQFSELEDEEGGKVWMKKFSERLSWADGELFNDLQAKGLDPALPHYSYKWLAPLLTHTLSVSSVSVVWDALFSHPMRERDMNPKLDYLLDICSAMLIHMKAPLFSLGRGVSSSSWARGDKTSISSSPLPAWKLGDALLEGMHLLQHYPLGTAGGIDGILQTASDLNRKREEAKARSQRDALSLGARLRVAMWKGFTNQEASPDVSPEVSDDELLVDPPKNEPLSLTSRLVTSLWRDKANQPSTEVLPTAVEPKPLVFSSSTTRQGTVLQESITVSGLQLDELPSFWGYTEKLKSSDAITTMAKVTGKWKAKVLPGSSGRSELTSPDDSPSASPMIVQGSFGGKESESEERWNGSSVSKGYSPPTRPAYFRSPRDSFISLESRMSPTSDLGQPASREARLMDSIQSSLASLTGGKTSALPAKSAPRPLLLSPSTSLTSPPSRPSSRASRTPTSDGDDWADVLKAKEHSLHESQSSMSSLSPSEFSRVKYDRRDWDSDTTSTSRRVPLNRRTVSPMAPGVREHQWRSMSGSSTTSSGGLLSPPPRPPFGHSKGWSPLHTSETSLSGTFLPELHESIDFPNDTTKNSGNGAQIVYETLENKPPGSPLTSLRLGAVSTSPRPLRSPRLRSKRYNVPHLMLGNQDVDLSRQQPVLERKIRNPDSLNVEGPVEDQEMVITPRASSFSVDKPSVMSPSLSPSPKFSKYKRRLRSGFEPQRKGSGEGQDAKVQPILAEQRLRDSSNHIPEIKTTDSSAEEGDNEGYDDLLSAYESEIETG